MSKIQDALKKIQASGATAARGSDDSSPSQIARVITQPVTNDDNTYDDVPEINDGRLVEVNRDSLRKAGLLAPEDQEKHVSDQYRLIKRPLLKLVSGLGADHPPHANLIMVASALPGDGKTFNAINIALSIAIEKDTSVLLVDADVAKPHISGLFGVEEQPGLIDLLVDRTLRVQETVIRTDIPGLSILPAGKRDANATELLASRRMAAVVTELSEVVPNRVVIFDSPPLLVTSESRVLAANMGQIALVVCANRTPQRAVLAAVDSLDQTKAINLILNQSGGALGADIYGGSYYGYGDPFRDSA